MTDYSRATASDPTNKFSYYDMGVIYQQHGDSADAASSYHRALLADPNYQSALYNLAVLLSPTDPGQATSLYRQLQQHNPNDPNVNFNLGLLLISQNQPTEGHTLLTKSLQEDPALRSRVPAGITP